MLRNYLIIAVRNMMRHKGYALINIFGLAIGMATFILIVRHIQDEFSYDAWHTKGDRIYRVLRETRSGGESEYLPFVSGALAGALEQDFPEVEEAVRVWFSFVEARYGDKKLELRVLAVDPEMFEVFDFPFVTGTLATAFPNPSCIAITESAARRVFGDEDPIGKTLTIESTHHGGEHTVTAVLKDTPHNSTIRFDYVSTKSTSELGRLAWTDWLPTYGWRPVHVYALLREGADFKALQAKLPALIERYMGPDIRKDNDYHLQPLPRIYLYSNREYGLGGWGYGDIDRVYQFGAIALFVLAIACINFTNLATARSARRSREVGLRKVTGAYRSQLLTQFLGESVLTTLLALVVALIIVRLVLPDFNAFFDKQLELNFLEDLFLAGALLGVAIVVGLAAGIYPAVFLSSFAPTETLKGTFRAGSRGQRIRKALVVTQFAISIVLIVGTGVVYQQLEYISNKNLGFNMEQMVLIPIFATDQGTKLKEAKKLADRYTIIKQAFLDHPNALEATAYRQWLGWGGGLTRAVEPEGHEGTDWRMPVLEVDEDYLDVFQIDMVSGRKFDPINFPSDTSRAFILNETAMAALGWDTSESGPNSAIGKSFKWVDKERNRVGHVIGVVSDFHYSPLRDKIGPAAMIHRYQQFHNLGVRIRTEGLDETIAFFERTWKRFVPENRPFQHYFWDQAFEFMYERERRVQTLTLISSGIAILLACMGLFGLASFATEERRKEIGVRKTLGATVSSVLVLVSREFALMVGIAALLAAPAAWIVMRGWLDNFAYRIELGPGVFLLGTLLTLAIAQATVAYHALRAARTDPVVALRYE